MASIALYGLFIATAILALASTMHSLWRFGGEALALPGLLRQCPQSREVRWTLTEHGRAAASATILRGDFRLAPQRQAGVRELRAAA